MAITDFTPPPLDTGSQANYSPTSTDSAKRKGDQLDELILQPGWTLEYNDDGSATEVISYRCSADQLENLRPQRYVSASPHFSSLICDHIRVKHIKANVVEIEVEYVGIIGSDAVQGEEEGILTQKSIPIQQSASFDSANAVYDDNELFQGFSKGSPSEGSFSVTVPVTTVRYTNATTVSPLGLAFPAIPSSVTQAFFNAGNTLTLSGLSWRRRGGIYIVSREYQSQIVTVS